MKWWQVNAQLYSVGMEQHGRTLSRLMRHGHCTPSGGEGSGEGERKGGTYSRGLPASSISNL